MDETNYPRGILTDAEMKELQLITSPDNRSPVPDELYSNASFDFRLDDEYFMPGTEKRISRCSDTLDTLIIPPFKSVIIGTYENLKLPNYVAGRFDLKIKWAMKGLIFQAGTQIEPGYEGKLFGILQNLSNNEISIRYKNIKATLLTAEFHFICKPANPKADVTTDTYKIMDFLKPESTIGDINDYFSSLTKNAEKNLASAEELFDRATNIQDKITSNRINFANFAFIIVVFGASLVLPIIINSISNGEQKKIDLIHSMQDSLTNKIHMIDEKLREIDSIKASIE